MLFLEVYFSGYRAYIESLMTCEKFGISERKVYFFKKVTKAWAILRSIAVSSPTSSELIGLRFNSQYGTHIPESNPHWLIMKGMVGGIYMTHSVILSDIISPSLWLSVVSLMLMTHGFPSPFKGSTYPALIYWFQRLISRNEKRRTRLGEQEKRNRMHRRYPSIGLQLPNGKKSILHLVLSNYNCVHHFFRRSVELVSKCVHEGEPINKTRPNLAGFLFNSVSYPVFTIAPI